MALLAVVVISCLMLNIGFFFGRTCCALYFWLSVAMVSGVMCVSSKKKSTTFLLVILSLLVVSGYMFSYLTSDSQRCHAVVQRFLVSGWNPVLQNTPDRLADIACYDTGGVSFYHMLYLPKVTGYVGAMVAMATGLWLGDAFLGNLMAVVIVMTALRFCRCHWGVVGWRAWVFAAFLFHPTHYISVFTGQTVDYVVYAMMITMVLACGNWYHSHGIDDLAVLVLSGVLALSVKANAYALVFLVFIGVMTTDGRRDIRVRRWMLFAIAAALILMASPLLTSWITRGSPFFPSHSFDASQKVMELCADMTGNDDALQMGYLARIVYAWFSKKLAVAGCAWWYGKTDFAPIFNVAVEGKGAAFTLLMFVSIICLTFSRKSKVWIWWSLLAVSCVLFPKRYIGYPRYVPQVWVLPVMAFYQFAFTRDMGRVGRIVRMAVPLLLLCYVLPFYARTGLNYMRSLTLEKIRQERLEQMSLSKDAYYLAQETRYWIYGERAKLAGVDMRTDGSGLGVNVDEEYFMYSLNNDDRFVFLPKGVFPQFNSVSDFKMNPWREYGQTLLHPPRPLWDR